MLLSKAIHLTDSVTESVATHLPAPLATPLQIAVAAVTWVPRHLVHDGKRVEEAVTPTPEPTDREETGAPTAPDESATAETEPAVVLNLDRPAEHVEPPIDVVGEALRAEAAESTSADTSGPLDDTDEHVEVEEEVVYSTSTDDA